MITKFDSLFAGHIDMDNVGYSGVAVNDRLFGNDSLSGVFDTTSNIAKTMDAGGLHNFWIAEHHFQRDA